MKVLLSVTIEQVEDGWYVVSAKQRPGCVSQGKTLPSALRNFANALAACNAAATRIRKEGNQ